MKYFRFLKYKNYFAIADGMFMGGYSIVAQKAIGQLNISDLSLFEILQSGINLLLIYAAYSKFSEKFKRVLIFDALLNLLIYSLALTVLTLDLNLGYYIKIISIIFIATHLLLLEATRHYETVHLGGSVKKSLLIKELNKRSRVNFILGSMIGSALFYMLDKYNLGVKDLGLITFTLGLMIETIYLWLVIRLKP